MENRNTFIAVALMLLLWVGYTIMFPTPQAPVSQNPPVAAPAAAVTEVKPLAPVAVSEPAPAAAAFTAPQRDIVIETDLYRAVVTSTGGRIKSLTLKNFKAATDSGQPVNLVTSTASGGTLGLSGEGDLKLAADAGFSIAADANAFTLSGTESKSLMLTAPLSSGGEIVKTYTFHANSYAIDLDVQIRNTTAAAKQGRLNLILQETPALDQTGDKDTDARGAVSFSKGKFQFDKLSSLDKSAKNYSENLTWSGYKTKYFLQAVAPLDPSAAADVNISKSGDQVVNRFQSTPLSVPANATLNLRYQAYFGPLDMELLKKAGHDLERAVDLGFFALLAKPLFHTLKFFYGFVGNYGWAIIILTVLIKLIFWPLTDKSYKSMKAMQKLQPEMQRLREKYKNDRDRMNMEIMNLYKEHRVNPLGGCLPMIIQIPVFFALYQALMNMVELRHAPFILWITDLSAKDPYYITPLIMGATMFIQQKLTPSQLDPVQQKIFLLMPIIFTIMFLNFPAGLVIYWLVNNVLSIAQQLMINRRKD